MTSPNFLNKQFENTVFEDFFNDFGQGNMYNVMTGNVSSEMDNLRW